jgi:hypothetical protein
MFQYDISKSEVTSRLIFEEQLKPPKSILSEEISTSSLLKSNAQRTEAHLFYKVEKIIYCCLTYLRYLRYAPFLILRT